MSRWEYKIIDETSVAAPGGLKEWNRESLENYLNHLGAEGWELINLPAGPMDGWDIFKAVLKRERGA